MYIVMNRFKIKPGHEKEFIDVWKGRDSLLHIVPGFIEFHLLQGESSDEFTLFSSRAQWESQDAFDAWTKSEAFRQAHASASTQRDIYLGPPQLECFEVVL